MKKLILIIAIVFSGMLMQAQIKGIDLSDAIKVADSTPIKDVYYRLVNLDSLYAIQYKMNTVGVVQSHRKILSILEANNLDFDKPVYNDSYLASNINGYDDYEAIPYSVEMGNSIISMGWIINEYGLAWAVTDEGVGIMIVPIKEFNKQ